jgi:DNA-binding transcriptional regulator YiaG
MIPVSTGKRCKMPKPRLDLEGLRETREMRGLTRVELAVLLGVDPGTIGHWERGDHYPRGVDEKVLRAWLESEPKQEG